MTSFIHNTEAKDYILDIINKIGNTNKVNASPSKRVIFALQNENPLIKTKGFRQNVFKEIFSDAINEQFFHEEYRERFLRRLKKWTGKNYEKHLIEICEILNEWKYSDYRFVPDAYLIDKKNKTVVCYEIEDSHPLNPFSIGAYAVAWWTLEYIYWDLHLIAYDIYGNPKVISFPQSGFIAEEEQQRRKPENN